MARSLPHFAGAVAAAFEIKGLRQIWPIPTAWRQRLVYSNSRSRQGPSSANPRYCTVLEDRRSRPNANDRSTGGVNFERRELEAVMGMILDEVEGPDMVLIVRPKSDA